MAGELRHYGAFVRSKPCAACSTPFMIEGHHALYGTTYSPDEPIPAKAIPNARKGAAQVSHDWFLIPLCMRKCHTPGLHKNAGFFQGWTGAAIEAWEREQVTEMHRLYDAEFPNGDPALAAKAARAATAKSSAPRKRATTEGPREREHFLEEIADWAGAKRLKDHEHQLIHDLINDLRAGGGA